MSNKLLDAQELLSISLCSIAIISYHIFEGLIIFIISLLQWVRLLNAFLEEAKWFASGLVPKADDYLKNGIVSTGAHMILVHSFFFMGDAITQETITLMDEFPSIISATATILRLCDDLEGDQVRRKSTISNVIVSL